MTSKVKLPGLGMRILDLLFAAIGLVPMIILCIPAIILIRLESKGNPVLCQQRVGQYQKRFTLFKLRSMLIDTDQVGTHEVSSARITKVGALLRKTKIDELPQIINVLLGHMSFVGPRPCLPTQVELIEERAMRGVYEAKPGITGAAQVAGITMETPVKLAEEDQAYLLERNVWMDVKLILRTFIRSR